MSNNEAKTVDSSRFIAPLADVYETADEFCLKIEMPGVRKDAISVVVNDDHLEISGDVAADKNETMEKKYSEFRLYRYYRKFRVGNSIDSSRINASMNDGVLSLLIPKSEKAKPRSIEIKTVN